MSFQFHRLDIPDVILIEPDVFKDSRGFFVETYKSSEFKSFGVPEEFVQDNWSHSTRNTLRGLHYQNHPKAQGKLLTVIKGEVFDVAVDLRKNSPTYGKWIAEVLTEKNYRILYIPVGFAHGFCVLSEKADFVYKVTAEYDREMESGIIWNDPTIGIDWPVSQPLISGRDAKLPSLRNSEHNFALGQ